jgi:hypothetical protein
MVYVLTNSNKIYVLDNTSTKFTFSFSAAGAIQACGGIRKPTKITFDEAGEFLYILVQVNAAQSTIIKFSAGGSLIGLYSLGVKANSIRRSHDRHLLVCTDYAIIKMQDIVNLFKIGDGFPTEFWSKDQIILSKNEFASDMTYNRSMVRMCQNIKMFRNTLNAKFSKVTEKTFNGSVTYYALVPISVDERPIFDSAIEDETVGIAVNEFHIPQVLNRELKKLYEAIYSLKEFLDISSLSLPDYKIENSGVSIICPSGFCWSWAAMSSYNLSLPTVRICNINPITYTELKASFPLQYQSDNWSKTWNDATSDCCNQNNSPLR